MNFENCPRRLVKTAPGGECTFAFGESQKLKKEVPLTKKWSRFESTVFKTGAVHNSNNSNDAGAKQESPPAKAVSKTFKTTMYDVKANKSARKKIVRPDEGIFRTNSCPQVTESAPKPVNNNLKSTVFDQNAKLQVPKVQKTKTTNETHADSIGADMMTSKSGVTSPEPRDSDTYRSSNIARNLSSNDFPRASASAKFVRTPRHVDARGRNSQMGQILGGADPIKAPAARKVSYHMRSQIFDSTAPTAASKSSTRGAKPRGWLVGSACVGSDDRNVVYSADGDARELRGRHRVPTSPAQHGNARDPITRWGGEAPRAGKPPGGRPVSRTMQSSIFDHVNQPRPNTAKPGYGRITQSSVFS